MGLLPESWFNSPSITLILFGGWLLGVFGKMPLLAWACGIPFFIIIGIFILQLIIGLVNP